jgi:hypothetical protein
MRFQYEGNQQVWIAKNGHPVIILGRTEFFNGREPRYYVRSDTAIPGKNINEDWINESQLTSIAPVVEEAPEKPVPQSKPGRRPGIRKTGFGGKVRN